MTDRVFLADHAEGWEQVERDALEADWGEALSNAGPLGGMFDCPHGAVCARLLPFAIEVNVAALAARAEEAALGLLQPHLGRSASPTVTVVNTLGHTRTGLAKVWIDRALLPPPSMRIVLRTAQLAELALARACRPVREDGPGLRWAWRLTRWGVDLTVTAPDDLAPNAAEAALAEHAAEARALPDPAAPPECRWVVGSIRR